MFSGLTSYFFGSSTTEEGETQEQQQKAAESTSRASPSPKRRTKSPSCGLKTVEAEEEEEWMLVDKTSSGYCLDKHVKTCKTLLEMIEKK